MITQARLKEVLSYDPETGAFRWIVAKSGVRAGDIAGGATLKGYRRIEIDGKRYMAHRLAFLYVAGRFPPDQVDHKNGIRDDNRYENLRHATNSFNLQNRKQANRDNRCGFLGVTLDGNRFKAKIKLNGKEIYLGLFKTPEEAHSAYLVAKRELHPGCTI